MSEYRIHRFLLYGPWPALQPSFGQASGKLCRISANPTLIEQSDYVFSWLLNTRELGDSFTRPMLAPRTGLAHVGLIEANMDFETYFYCYAPSAKSQGSSNKHPKKLDISRCRVQTCKDFVQALTGCGTNARFSESAIFVRGFLYRPVSCIQQKRGRDCEIRHVP